MYYGYGGYASPRYWGYYYRSTGLKFSLNLVPKQDSQNVQRGVVTVNGVEIGIVDNFDSWQNGHIPVLPGKSEVLVTLQDGRDFRTTVGVRLGQVLTVYLRFPPSENEKK